MVCICGLRDESSEFEGERPLVTSSPLPLLDLGGPFEGDLSGSPNSTTGEDLVSFVPFTTTTLAESQVAGKMTREGITPGRGSSSESEGATVSGSEFDLASLTSRVTQRQLDALCP